MLKSPDLPPPITMIPDRVMARLFRIVRYLVRKTCGSSPRGVAIVHQLDAAERLLKYSNGIRARQIKRLVIFATDSCHSKCLHCGIWRIKEPKFLPLSIFKGVIDGIDETVDVIITGGEALEHPQIEAMVQIMTARGIHFTLLSNGSYPERLVALVEKYRIPEVILSCDGMRETYRRMRGVDWFPNIERLVKDLRDKTNIALTFTMSFWNSRADLAEVSDFASTNGAVLSVGIHGDCASVHTKIPVRLKKLYPVADMITNRFAKRYYALYRDWLEGHVFLPCFSIRYTGTVYADGRFGICEAKDIIVGNLYEKSMEEIWNDPETIRIQASLVRCNGCWLTNYRRNDVVISELMTKVLPSRVIDRVIGHFDWAKVSGPIPVRGATEEDNLVPLLVES